jgi:hypothetical protein
MTTQITPYYKWILNDETGNHCSRCRSHAGQVKTMERWDLTATPPLHAHCGCRLEFDHADTAETPDGTGETANNPSGPLGIAGEYPPAVPAVTVTGPVYPPTTPPAVIVPYVFVYTKKVDKV